MGTGSKLSTRRCHQRCSPLTDARGKSAGAARGLVEMDRRQDRDRRNLAAICLAHFMRKADRLVLNLKQLRMNSDDIAGQQLALVPNGLLDCRHAATVLAQECGRQSDRMESAASPRRTYRRTTSHSCGPFH